MCLKTTFTVLEVPFRGINSYNAANREMDVLVLCSLNYCQEYRKVNYSVQYYEFSDMS